VLTVFDWATEVLADWLQVRGSDPAAGLDLFVTERGTLVSGSTLRGRLRRYCDELGLSPGLDFHSLRRSYVTHLLEDGWDPLFVQQQAGHEHASTTAIYTCVSSDYRVKTLRTALDGMIRDALPQRPATAGGTPLPQSPGTAPAGQKGSSACAETSPTPGTWPN
jgi:integrase